MAKPLKLSLRPPLVKLEAGPREIAQLGVRVLPRSSRAAIVPSVSSLTSALLSRTRAATMTDELAAS